MTDEIIREHDHPTFGRRWISLDIDVDPNWIFSCPCGGGAGDLTEAEAEAMLREHRCLIYPCGCPVPWIIDQGHQEGCDLEGQDIPDTILIAWMDGRSLPRAYATGPFREYDKVQERAKRELDAYCTERGLRADDYTENILTEVAA